MAAFTDGAATMHTAADTFIHCDKDCDCGSDGFVHLLKEKPLITEMQGAHTQHTYLDPHVDEVDWQSQSFAGLINHIMLDYHLFLRSELPLLSEFTCRMMKNHKSTHRELFELNQLFHQLKQDLEQHLFIEEEQVFPLIEEYAKRNSLEALQQAQQEVNKLEAEHRELGELLKRMRQLTSGYSLPDNSCKIIALTYAAMERLEAKLLGHIHVENTFLFPRIKRH